MEPVALHRLSSRYWVGAEPAPAGTPSVTLFPRIEAIQIREELRFVRERVALGDETAQLMGGSVDRFLQLAGRFYQAYRLPNKGLPEGFPDPVRRRAWKKLQVSHERFARMAALHFQPALLPDFKGESHNARYLAFLAEWIDAVAIVLREWAWLRQEKGKVRSYLIGSAVKERKRRWHDAKRDERLGRMDKHTTLREVVPEPEPEESATPLPELIQILRDARALEPAQARRAAFDEALAWWDLHGQDNVPDEEKALALAEILERSAASEPQTGAKQEPRRHRNTQ